MKVKFRNYKKDKDVNLINFYFLENERYSPSGSLLSILS